MKKDESGSGEAAGNIRLLWIMLLAYFTFGFVLNVVGVMIPVLIREYRLSLFAGGLLAFALYIPFGICSIPAGLAADRFGSKPVVLSGILMMAGGCGGIASAKGFVSIMISAFVVGGGIAVLETAGNPLIERLDREENYHRNLTLTIGFCGIGAFTGPFCLSALQSHGKPWQELYVGYAILCAALLVLFSLSRFPKQSTNAAESLRLREISKVLGHRVAITYFLAIFFYVGAEVGTASWIVRFFQEVHGLGEIDTDHVALTLARRVVPALPALTVSLFWGLQGVGRLVSGLWIHKLGARFTLRLYAIAATGCFLVAIFGSVHVTAIGFAACGFFTSVLFTLLFSGAIHTFIESKGTVSGLLVAASIGGGIIPPLVGLSADHFGIQIAMAIPFLCFLYVTAVSLVGKAKYE